MKIALRLAAASLVALAACQSPTLSTGAAAASRDIRLTFIVSGAGPTPAPASRLLLPNAAKLKVSLIPASSSTRAPAAQEVGIGSGQTSVPLSFASVPYGSYTVSAQAFSASGALLMHQESSLSVGANVSSASVPLVPANTTDLAVDVAASADLPVTRSESFVVPVSSMSRGAFDLDLGATDASVLCYIQDQNGTALSSDPAARHFQGRPASGDYAYVTLYNTGSGLPHYDATVLAPTWNLSYAAPDSDSGTVPAATAAYHYADSAMVYGNAGGFARTGYVFVRWDTLPSGTGTAYASGDYLAMADADVVLYAVWARDVGDAGVTVVDPTLVSVSLSNPTPTLSYGVGIGETATPSTTVDSYAWYLDGTPLASTTASASTGLLSYGPHTIMVVVSKNGTYYSATHRFTVK